MPRQNLSSHECEAVLAEQNLTRVGFHDGKRSYLIPLGYVYLNSALYGVADSGQNTEMAKQNPSVSFQVDTSSETGLWEWRSVTGQGIFEIVENEEEKQMALKALQPVIA